MKTIDQKVLSRLDQAFCLDFLSRMVQHKSYSQTDGETTLVRWVDEQLRVLGLEAATHFVQEMLTGGRDRDAAMSTLEQHDTEMLL